MNIYNQLQHQHQRAATPLQDEDTLKRLVSTPPLNDVQRLQHIQALYTLGEVEQANAVYRVLIKNQQGNITQLNHIANALERARVYPLAKDAYKIIVARQPSNRLAIEGLKRIDQEKKQALTLYYQAIHVEDSPTAKAHLLEASLMHDPTLAESHVALARHYLTLKDTAKARDHFNQYLSLAKHTMTVEEAAALQHTINGLH